MFNEKNVSFVNRQKLWNYYNSTLVKAVDVGYNPKTKFYDEDLAKSLKQNIAEFSAFKETSFKKEVESLLTTDGRLTPKSEWKKEALKVSDDYNYRWLETERHQTIANAHMAEKWKDFEQNVELYPNLQLVSVNDARVRPKHKVLDGIIRPFNDPFWKTHTPPLDWGCRCDIIQTDDEVTEVPGGFQTKIEFENNPGDSGKVFGGSAYEENLTKKEKAETLENLNKFSEKEDYKVLHKNKVFSNSVRNLDDEFKNEYPDIDPEKVSSVRLYTRAYYEDINRFNRGLPIDFDKKAGFTKEYYESLTRTINKGLDEMPNKFKGTVYRGTHINDSSILSSYKDAFEKGHPHIEKSFLSTSYDESEAFGGNVSFSIKSKTGTNVENLSASKSEKEILFKAGQKFKVTNYKEYEEGIIHIEMEEI